MNNPQIFTPSQFFFVSPKRTKIKSSSRTQHLPLFYYPHHSYSGVGKSLLQDFRYKGYISAHYRNTKETTGFAQALNSFYKLPITVRFFRTTKIQAISNSSRPAPQALKFRAASATAIFAPSRGER